MSEKLTVWYEKGVNFKCTGCGDCCTGGPGYTWINREEIVEMARFLKLEVHEFSRKYLRQIGSRYALLEKNSYDCIFLEERRCTVYSVRPTQCQTFPFWPGNMQSAESWRGAAKFCEGICDEAPTVPFEEITHQLERQSREEL